MRGLICLFAALCCPGCTALVVSDLLDDRAPCETPEDCIAGFVCTADNVCEASDELGVPPPAGSPVDEEGATITGPDDVTLIIPPGAVAELVHLEIVRASSTIVPTGVDDVSAFYRVVPDVALAAPVTFAIPVDCADCSLFVDSGEEDVAWIELAPPTVAPANTVSGTLDALGEIVVAGRPQ